MHIAGSYDGSASNYSEPGQRWTDADFGLLLRMLGEGRRILVEVAGDLLSSQGIIPTGTLMEPTYYDHDCDEIGFAADDSMTFRTEDWRLVRPSEDIRGRTVSSVAAYLEVRG